MSRHRLDPPRRVRPRYGRMGAAAVSLVVTAVALLGGLGVLPVEGAPDRGQAAASGAHAGTNGSAVRTGTTGTTGASVTKPDGSASTAPTSAPTSATTPTSGSAPTPADPASVPAGTGHGQRVVFSKGAQRVWLVDATDTVASTYLVSGSLTNNLRPGTYAVYSRSRWAVGVQDTGVMQYFVRFAHGSHAAIGFHSIPTKHGVPLQSEAQLGTPQSHGCIRQRLSDAVRMWDFADVGTHVVVVA